jgi:hypothetical protein
MTIKHSIANYPKAFHGYVVSPTKICFQFEDVQSKLRFKEGGAYVKLPNTIKALPVPVSGVEVDILAVGCQMPVLELLCANMIEAFREYGLKHSEIYQQTYNKEFLVFLENTMKRLGEVLEDLNYDNNSNSSYISR